MNKLMAILFALGAIGFLAMSQRDSYEAQNFGRWGPVGKKWTVQVTKNDKTGYIVFGVASMIACFYFLSRIRDDDLGK